MNQLTNKGRSSEKADFDVIRLSTLIYVYIIMIMIKGQLNNLSVKKITQSDKQPKVHKFKKLNIICLSPWSVFTKKYQTNVSKKGIKDKYGIFQTHVQ